MSTEITLRFQLSDQFLSDVLATAFDSSGGACWYWAKPRKGRDSWTVDSDDTWRSVQIIEREAQQVAGKRKWANVTHELMGRGIARALDPSFKVNSQIRACIASLDAGEIDAAAADVIVQAAIFGEIVYG